MKLLPSKCSFLLLILEHETPWQLHAFQKLALLKTRLVLLKTRESQFSLVWVMEFSIISSCLGKAKVFPITLTRQSQSTHVDKVCMKTVNELSVFLMGFIHCLKNLSCCFAPLYQNVLFTIELDYSQQSWSQIALWYNNSCRTQIMTISIHLIGKKCSSFQVIY